jgi:hypothetical protein
MDHHYTRYMYFVDESTTAADADAAVEITDEIPAESPQQPAADNEEG